MQNIHIFETREVNYLKPYITRATALGFNVVMSDNSTLQGNKLFEKFTKVYKHYSVNTPEFEIACFARYFAIATQLENDEPFLLNDTDVYLTDSFKALQGHALSDTFIGSEGFDNRGTQEQISPHCSFWNRPLLMDFIDFIIETYERDQEKKFLSALYQSLTEKYKRTAISDMNLLYLWINDRNIPYINSNSSAFAYGIDHNISSVKCQDADFKQFAGRKLLRISGKKIHTVLTNGAKQDMALLHFQGVYKGILAKFYDRRFLKFIYFSLKNHYRK